MQMNEHAPGILFPRLPQLFSAQPVLPRDLLHSIEMRNHRQYSAHARLIVLQRIVEVAPRMRLIWCSR
jgi:hypothetical protein